jgi:DNA-binding NarL/FixJ family response regulator
MDKKVEVLILFNNRLAREAIARILNAKPDLRVVAAQSTTSCSIQEIANSKADVLVLDSLQLFLKDLPIPQQSSSGMPAIKCVLVAMEDDEKKFLSAVRRGALGYVLQDAAAADVVAAIRGVARGEAVCPPQYTRSLFQYVSSQAGDPQNSRRRAQMGLTSREQQLVPMIGRGMTNKEIASQLSLSEQTVKNHVHRILRKAGVGDRLSVFEACQPRSLAS